MTYTKTKIPFRFSIVRMLHRSNRRYIGKKSNFCSPDDEHYDYQGQTAGDYIRDMLICDKPCMVGRMGAAEMSVVDTYLAIQSTASYLKKSLGYITGKSPCFWWDPKTILAMSNNAGFFPSNEQNLVRYAQRTLEDVREVDILGSWMRNEQKLFDYNPNIKTVWLPDLEPYRHANPWSEALEGKRVLVVHPFEESIRRQYSKRRLLFKDRRVLPEFKLVTLKAVQSIAGNKVPFSNWFEALDWMCEKIKTTNFDIAIIGAGAYGFSLAAYVKRIGKKAVHLGGATQLLFGIRGKRWDNELFVNHLYNEHWVRPLPEEVPQNFQAVEHGCYW